MSHVLIKLSYVTRHDGRAVHILCDVGAQSNPVGLPLGHVPRDERRPDPLVLHRQLSCCRLLPCRFVIVQRSYIWLNDGSDSS